MNEQEQSGEQGYGQIIKQLQEELKLLDSKEKIYIWNIGNFTRRIFGYLRSKMENKTAEKSEVLDFFSTELRKIFTSILSEIKAKSGDLGNFEAIELAKSMLTTDTKFSFPQDPSRPVYNVDTNTIHVPEARLAYLSNGEVPIIELLTDGYVLTANIIHHEYVHSLQSEKLKLSERIKNMFGQLDVNRDLKEVHAMIGSDRKGRAKSIRLDYVVRQLESDYPASSPDRMDRVRIMSAWNSVYELYALGLSDEEIGTLIKKAKWDTKTQSFSVLSDKVTQICQERKISKKDLSDLVTIDHLKSEIQIEKNRLISKEYLENLLST